VRTHRVLAERENYVLLAEYTRLNTPGSATEYFFRTTFIILYLQYRMALRERSPEQADMIYNYCGDYRLKNGEKDFRLPKATLLRIFATSFCLRNLFSHAQPTNLSFGNGLWGGFSFARITDANKGTGWLRMRWNEQILGLPQGTVPEPK